MRTRLTRIEAVYRREHAFVWAAARRLGVHPATIDDAVQDVFVTAYRRWDDLDPEVSPRAWLYGVTRRVAFRYRRTQARTARRKDAVAVAVAARRRHEPQRALDDAHDVDIVLGTLEPRRREVFVMSELLDMKGPEIAAQLRIPLNTVYSRLRLARRQLAQTVNPIGGWIDVARRTQRPPPGRARRSWALMLPTLRPWWHAAASGSMASTLGLTVAAAIGALVIMSATVGRGESPTRPRALVATPSPASIAVDLPADVRPAAEPPTPSPLASTRPTVAEPIVQPRPSSETSVATSRAARSRSAPPRSPAPSSEPDGDTGPSEATSEPASTLAAEVAVLDRAAEALREGEAARALQWLAEHETRFPRGRLVDVRKATQVRALCRLGRHDRAQAEAQALRLEHPDSAVARAVSDSCGGA
ncbi:MAG: sigma-70 family RNA polymerase sigma factor [Nannocystaceae bacterium]